MSTTFKEFLRERAAKEAVSARERQGVVEDWRGAVERLYGQIRAWLADSDPSGLIQIEVSDEQVREEGLGTYRVPRLDLRAFGKWVAIIPKAIQTVGTAQLPHKTAPERALSRVDITDEIRRYILYRFREESAMDLGMMHDGRGPAAKPLTQQDFEIALMSYFR